MKNPKAKASSLEFKRYRWAFKMFVVSMCLSCLFSLLSHSVLSSLGAIMACVLIAIFIFIAVVFDMIGIAVASADEEFFKKKVEEREKGSEIALQLTKNSEKVCSFCADVVGDICGILSGAGGATVSLSITRNLFDSSTALLVTTFVSALIAGLTILFKALMKGKAIKNADKIILRLGRTIETIFFPKRKKREG